MFKDARKAVGMSIEEAAWRIHIGTRTLVNYENGHTLVPPEVALKMAEVYSQPTLTARYCAEHCPIGQKYAYPVERRDLPAAVLGLIKEFNDVKLLRDKLIELASDGVISEDEVPEFERILNELMDLEQKIESLKLLAASVVPIDQLIRRRKEKAPLKGPKVKISFR